ncbi:M20/M25/M40 family metallo-hydrolase [Lentibacillus sp. CBA3610]|uniref:M20/M25/M40 family metallo-hydrolase n=1 Tax=Lentibacillus sp. CBA3610 TaxID=2518176 RepID=UPI001595AE68|nr:M20/M25/M40 family metallo-hydrolase [Lentibacillus sp. CBA3610]QKY70265.1 M20/M25/M40 family metallo-hydrolase [Lentibacillus sp. CBA3610]
MFHQLKSLSTKEQVETITRHLVGIKSINSTVGERVIIDELYQMLQSFPYFQRYPNNLWTQDVEDDPVGRKNLFAFVEGSPETKDTIIYHAHIDTVGVNDFGALKDRAFAPDDLESYFAGYTYDEELKQEAQTGDWLFGRGALDMKSGAAVHIANLLYFSEHTRELNGNILLILNGDEESEHKGIITALSELKSMQRAHGLNYVMAINTDFTTPLYDGDKNKYVYTGTAGKVLPSFFIYGRESHVGDTLAGIDPNFIAAKITERIHNNYALAETIPGEYVLPPTCLYQRDTKQQYTVQTAPSSQLYYNYFLFEATPEEVLDQLLAETKQACTETAHYLRDQFNAFTSKTGYPTRNLSWDVEVTTYREFNAYLEAKGIDTQAVINQVLADNDTTELRELSFEIVSALQELDPNKKPRVILFFAPPFLPHNYLKDNDSRDEFIKESIEKAIEAVSEETGEKFAIKKFFPYLADGSFLSIHEAKEELPPLLDNLPEWKRHYNIPFSTIKEFNLPSINMGVYGKDGHKWTERVYKPYSFETLPTLIRKTTVHILNEYAFV